MKKSAAEAEQIALDVPKPSINDLEHGLELHKNSLVCESYGFSPWCTVYWVRLAEAVRAMPVYMMPGEFG